VKLPKLTRPPHLPPEKLSPYMRCGQNPGEAAAVPAVSIGHDDNPGSQRPRRTRSEYGLHGEIQSIHRKGDTECDCATPTSVESGPATGSYFRVFDPWKIFSKILFAPESEFSHGMCHQRLPNRLPAPVPHRECGPSAARIGNPHEATAIGLLGIDVGHPEEMEVNVLVSLCTASARGAGGRLGEPRVGAQ
jgi:hypothetical protein